MGLSNKQINKVASNNSGWADYADTRYTVGSPYSLADTAKVVLPHNSTAIVDTQKPLDINTFFYSAKLTIDAESVFAIGDTLTGGTSGATGTVADIIGSNLFIVNISNTPFQSAEVVTAQDSATANTTAVDLEPAITGRNGDGLNITVEFKVKPDGVAASPRVKMTLDINGAVGEIYPNEQILSKGSGVEHYFLRSFNGYSLGTFLANGGKVTIEAIGEDLLIYDYRLVITRTHKAKEVL